MGPGNGNYGGGGVDPQVTNSFIQNQNTLKSQDTKLDHLKSELKEATLRDDSMSSMVETLKQELLEAMEKERKDKVHEHA